MLVEHRQIDTVVGASQVVLALGRHRQDRRKNECENESHDGRIRFDRRPECPEEHQNRQDRRHRHRSEADRIDVVEHAASELGHLRRQLEDVLVEHDVRGHHCDPRDTAVGVEAEDAVEEVEHVGFHQDQRDGQVEQHEHHAARIRLGEASVRVGPRQRSGIGVGHVDLDLADDDQDHREGHGEPTRHEVLVDLQELVHRLVGDAGSVDDVGDQVHGEEEADDLLEGTEDDPAGAGEKHCGPPASGVLGSLGRHEAQVVDLFGDLRDERETDSGREHHRSDVDALAVGPVLTAVGEELPDRVGIADHQVHERQYHQDEPHRGGPDLKFGKGFHAVDDQRDDHDGRDRVPDGQRDAQPQFESLRHDRTFEREEDERERREDDVGDDRSVVAETASTRDQVEVDVVTGRIVGKRKAGQEDDDGEHQNAPQCIAGSVRDSDIGTDGEIREIRDAAERGRRDNTGPPLTVATRREAQRVVLERLFQRGVCRRWLYGGHGSVT